MRREGGTGGRRNFGFEISDFGLGGVGLFGAEMSEQVGKFAHVKPQAAETGRAHGRGVGVDDIESPC